MDVNLFVAILLVIVAFAMGLWMYVFAGPVQRSKFLRLQVGVYVIFVIIFSFLLRDSDYFPFMFIWLMGFGILVPRVIAMFVNQYRVKPQEPVFKIRASSSEIQSTIVAMVFVLFFSIMMAVPRKISLATGAGYYDRQQIYGMIWALLLCIVPEIVALVMKIIQKNVIHANGLLCEGIIWSWSDFQLYSWKLHPKDKKIYNLLLMTIHDIRTPSEVKVSVPIELKDQVEALLSQKLRKGKESDEKIRLFSKAS